MMTTTTGIISARNVVSIFVMKVASASMSSPVMANHERRGRDDCWRRRRMMMTRTMAPTVGGRRSLTRRSMMKSNLGITSSHHRKKQRSRKKLKKMLRLQRRARVAPTVMAQMWSGGFWRIQKTKMVQTELTKMDLEVKRKDMKTPPRTRRSSRGLFQAKGSTLTWRRRIWTWTIVGTMSYCGNIATIFHSIPFLVFPTEKRENMPRRRKPNERLRNFLAEVQANEWYPFASEFEYEIGCFIVEERLSTRSGNGLLAMCKKGRSEDEFSLKNVYDLRDRLSKIPKERWDVKPIKNPLNPSEPLQFHFKNVILIPFLLFPSRSFSDSFSCRLIPRDGRCCKRCFATQVFRESGTWILRRNSTTKEIEYLGAFTRGSTLNIYRYFLCAPLGHCAQKRMRSQRCLQRW